MGRTLYDKIWDEHVVHTEDDGTALLYIDRHLVHEVTSPQAFEGLRARRAQAVARRLDRRHRRPQHADHATAHDGIADPISRLQVETLDANMRRATASTLLPVCATSARASCTSSGRSRARRCPA